jgi:SulP family sulfate permease
MQNGYSLDRFRGDLFGGLTAGIEALPLALAFGVASGYGAIALGFFASLFGGTPSQVSGPTGPMTVIFAAAVTTFPGDGQAVLGVVLLAGILQIVFGYMKVGIFVRFIPYPVISGFMSGIGIIIILIQLHPLFGAAGVGSPIEAVLKMPNSIVHLNSYSVFLAMVTMAVVFLTPPRISRIVPSPLIALLAGRFSRGGFQHAGRNHRQDSFRPAKSYSTSFSRYAFSKNHAYGSGSGGARHHRLSPHLCRRRLDDQGQA